MPGNMHAGIKAMEARFRKYMQTGNKVAAEEYLLTDFADTTQYLSTLSTDNSINVCMDSTIAFIRYVIKAIKRMHEGIQPLKEYHFGGTFFSRGGVRGIILFAMRLRWFEGYFGDLDLLSWKFHASLHTVNLCMNIG